MRAKQWRKWLINGVLVVIVLWLGSLIWGLTSKAQIAITQANETKAQYAALEARKNKLQGDLDSLQTPRGQDASIREAFSVAKSGEEVIIVVPPAPATTTPKKSWWQNFLDWF